MDTLIIIDGNSVVHRAYHALPELTAKGKGMVNAVYGFLLVFLKAINDFKPDYIAVCFDTKPPTFRHKKFGEYKAGRKKAPQDLYDQIPMIKEILTAMDVAIFEKPGFEADDLIGTIANKAPQKQAVPEIQTIIVSSDFDVFQLANNNTKVYNLLKGVKQGEVFDANKIKEKFGISPEQIVDFKALAGDASDNIPGATGIGKTTATKLIQEYESVEKLYKALESGDAWDMKQRTKELLLVNKEQVLLSYELAKIDRTVDIDLDIKKCSWRAPGSDANTMSRVTQKLDEFQFYTLKNRL
jgi:DNA polymerase-1